MVKMAKDKKSFIDLTDKPEEPAGAAMPDASETRSEPRGPTVYIHGADLPLTVDDVGKTGTATIQYKVRDHSVSKSAGNGGKLRKSYDLEIKGIKFND